MEQNRLNLKACAKINLGLDVMGKLPNGYHQVKMIMQSIDLTDELTFEKTDGGITLTSDAAGLATDESNLIYRAAKLMQETYALREGVKIHLTKRIPIAAGMAGGSTDAAAAMQGINRLFHLRIPTPELMRLALRLGADIPFCLLGGTALAEGIGEELTPLPPVPAFHVVTATPDISVSTRDVYAHLDGIPYACHPDIDGMADAIRQGSLQGILERMGNVLESVTIPTHPIIASIKQEMLQLGADGALMSGSGPTVFGMFREAAAAREAVPQLRAKLPDGQIFLAAPV